MDTDRVIRRKQLLELIGVSTVTQWRMEKAGEFPKRFKVGKGAVGWHLCEVEEWLRSRKPVERQMVERTCVRRATDRALLDGEQTAAADGYSSGGLGLKVDRPER
jgi:prophage regulatory protein